SSDLARTLPALGARRALGRRPRRRAAIVDRDVDQHFLRERAERLLQLVVAQRVRYEHVRRDAEGSPAGGIGGPEIGLDVLDAGAALRQDVAELADDADPVVARELERDAAQARG